MIIQIWLISLQFHPDIQQSKNLSQAQIDANHEKFVQINTAYEILSKKHDRKNYDRELRMEQERQVYEKYGVGERGKTVDFNDMTMEDRARVYGYYKDVHFQYNSDKYWIAGACIFVAIASYFIHFNIAKLSYKSHVNALDRMTKELSEIEEEKKSEAVKNQFVGNDAVRNWIMKTDNASGDNLREFDKYQAKLEARKRSKNEELVAEEQ